MNNYCNFTKFIEDGLAMDIFNGMSSDRLKKILDDYFNNIDLFLNNFLDNSKMNSGCQDYAYFYNQAKYLIEEFNDIKIIINIIIERNTNE